MHCTDLHLYLSPVREGEGLLSSFVFVVFLVVPSLGVMGAKPEQMRQNHCVDWRYKYQTNFPRIVFGVNSFFLKNC